MQHIFWFQQAKGLDKAEYRVPFSSKEKQIFLAC